MSFKVLGSKVAIMQEEAVEKTKSGILLPETAKEKPSIGQVVAVGNGRVNNKGTVIPMEVKTGDSVIYNKYSGTKVSIEDKEYIILEESDILVVL